MNSVNRTKIGVRSVEQRCSVNEIHAAVSRVYCIHIGTEHNLAAPEHLILRRYHRYSVGMRSAVALVKGRAAYHNDRQIRMRCAYLFEECLMCTFKVLGIRCVMVVIHDEHAHIERIYIIGDRLLGKCRAGEAEVYEIAVKVV